MSSALPAASSVALLGCLVLASCSTGTEAPSPSNPASGPGGERAAVAADPDLDAFARRAVAALAAADEDGFVALHVKKGDMTVDGSGFITTHRGVDPDEGWDRDVRAAFARCRAELAPSLGDLAGMSFDGVVGAKARDGGRGYWSADVAVSQGGGRAVVGLGGLMRSKRGLVRVAAPPIVLSGVVPSPGLPAATPVVVAASPPVEEEAPAPPGPPAVDRPRGDPAWFEAVRGGDGADVEARLAAGQDVNAVDHQGASALLHAVIARDAAMVDLLIARGADVNHQDQSRQTALMWSGNRWSWDVMGTLLDHGADPRVGVSAMFFVVQNGRTDLVQRLLDGGLSPTAKDLEVARAFGHADIVALLEPRVR